MDEKDFADMIRLARRAPLKDMAEAEAAAALLQRFAAFANECIEGRKQDKGTPRDAACLDAGCPIDGNEHRRHCDNYELPLKAVD